MNRLFSITVLMLSFIAAYAAPKATCSFTHLTVDQGLSNNYVESMCQDKLGRMWFATSDGVNCYDGYDLVIYKHDPQNEYSIQSNIINRVYLDRNQDLWVCTANGLSRYDYEKDIFCRINIPGYLHSVEHITQITDNVYIVGTREYTYCYDKSDNNVWKCLLNGQDVSFYSIAADDGVIVGGTVRSKEVLTLVYEGGELKEKNPPVRMKHTISALLKAANGSYWVGQGKGGLYLVDPKSGTMSRPGEFLPESISVDDLIYDSFGRLWVGASDGLYVLEPTSRAVQKFCSDGNHRSLSHDAIRSVYCDRTGGMWVGTEYGGVNYWNGRNEVFSQLRYSESLSKNDRIVTAMYMDDDNSLWIGTRHGGLNHHFPATGKTVTYDIGNIRSVLPVDGSVYVGTGVTGWKILNKKSGRIRSFALPTDVNDFLRMSDGRILVGSLSGLFVYDPLSGVCSKIQTRDDGRGLRVLCMHEDACGTLWVGAKEGLKCFKYLGEGRVEEADMRIPAHIVQIQCLYESRDSHMWVGTADGLFVYDFEKGVMNMIQDVPGLTQITIKGIEEDRKGDLWISTDNGLTRYNPDTGDNRTYYARDGLLSNQFNAYSSHCADSYGNLYFGGLGGITSFDPMNVTDNKETCPPIITGLRLFNVDVRSSDGTGILAKHISLTESLELRHDQNSITLSFACTDYASGGRNRFRYKMEGIDKDWIDADGRSVTYANMDKGRYCFVLESSNSDGLWAPTKARLYITVRPIWYRTLFANIIIVLFALLTLCYVVYRIGKHQDLKNAEKIDVLERKHEEDVRRARVASYVTDPYLLKQSDEMFVETVLNHIDDNLVNPQFSVERLASLMGMTRANLHLKVKAFTGISPVELIRRIRVETACRLIREGRHTMAEIGDMTGFNSATYFATVFKKVVGSTPGEYAASLTSESKI